MSRGKRRTVPMGRSAWVEAVTLFLVLATLGVVLGALGGPAWLTLSCPALGMVMAVAWLCLGSRPASTRLPPLPEPRPGGLLEDTATPADSADAAAPLRPRRAVGYVCVTCGGGSSELAAHSEVIGAWAAENGVTLTSIMHDVEVPTRDSGSRPALRGALERIAARQADTLVTARLMHLSPTVANLSPLLRWFSASSRTLVAIDLRLDSATEAGRLATSALADIARWEHERLSARTRRGLRAARARGSGGGPASVADVPGLKQWIERMREQGMTLQAIADALNEAGVPTLRGGAKWRPSSVQRATGYRRPPTQQPSADLPWSTLADDDESAPPS
jgi:DNA invertase Pin-like site-specific DNA recombinase